MLNVLGNLSLNCCFVLYLIYYFPQLYHNQRHLQMAQLSLGMHFLLILAYIFDLFYGYAMHLQWQYRLVSWVGLGCLMVQHWQFIRYFFHERLRVWLGIQLLMMLIFMLLLCDFFLVKTAELSQQECLMLGYGARICFILCALPQVLKSHRYESLSAISLHYIYLNMSVISLDFISAWCLDWGWPNKLGGVPMILLMFYLLKKTRSSSYRHVMS